MSTELPDGLTWVKATASNDKGACVEVAKLPDGGRAIRHSQDPDGPTLRYTEAEWTAFLDGTRKGEFD